MAWFRRSKENIQSEGQKKETPDGLWTKCGGCGEIIHRRELEQKLFTCPKGSFHFRIGSKDYFALLLDAGSFSEMDKKLQSADPLNFVDTKKYSERLKETVRKTGLYDAVRTGTGKINAIPVVVACMDFTFVGGGMGSVVGEKIARAYDR